MSHNFRFQFTFKNTLFSLLLLFVIELKSWFVYDNFIMKVALAYVTFLNIIHSC